MDWILFPGMVEIREWEKGGGRWMARLSDDGEEHLLVRNFEPHKGLLPKWVRKVTPPAQEPCVE